MEIFLDFFRFFFSGVGWTGELWSNRVVLILRNKEDFFFFFIAKGIVFKKLGFFCFLSGFFYLCFFLFLTTFEIFKNSWVFYEFLNFLNFIFLFLFFIFFLQFFQMFSLYFYRCFSKLLRLLLKVTKVTTGHQKWAKTA